MQKDGLVHQWLRKAKFAQIAVSHPLKQVLMHDFTVFILLHHTSIHELRTLSHPGLLLVVKVIALAPALTATRTIIAVVFGTINTAPSKAEVASC